MGDSSRRDLVLAGSISPVVARPEVGRAADRTLEVVFDVSPAAEAFDRAAFEIALLRIQEAFANR